MRIQWKFVLVGVGAFVLGGVCDRLLFEEITDCFKYDKIRKLADLLRFI